MLLSYVFEVRIRRSQPEFARTNSDSLCTFHLEFLGSSCPGTASSTEPGRAPTTAPGREPGREPTREPTRGSTREPGRASTRASTRAPGRAPTRAHPPERSKSGDVAWNQLVTQENGRKSMRLSSLIPRVQVRRFRRLSSTETKASSRVWNPDSEVCSSSEMSSRGIL